MAKPQNLTRFLILLLGFVEEEGFMLCDLCKGLSTSGPDCNLCKNYDKFEPDDPTMRKAKDSGLL